MAILLLISCITPAKPPAPPFVAAWLLPFLFARTDHPLPSEPRLLGPYVLWTDASAIVAGIT